MGAAGELGWLGATTGIEELAELETAGGALPELVTTGVTELVMLTCSGGGGATDVVMVQPPGQEEMVNVVAEVTL